MTPAPCELLSEEQHLNSDMVRVSFAKGALLPHPEANEGIIVYDPLRRIYKLSPDLSDEERMSDAEITVYPIEDPRFFDQRQIESFQLAMWPDEILLAEVRATIARLGIKR